MKGKMRNYLCRAIHSVILAGAIVFFIGLYYWMIKAGLPYQDAPLKLQIQYEVNMRIGEILLGNGFGIITGGGIVRLLLGWLWKKNLHKQQTGNR